MAPCVTGEIVGIGAAGVGAAGIREGVGEAGVAEGVGEAGEGKGVWAYEADRQTNANTTARGNSFGLAVCDITGGPSIAGPTLMED